LEERKFIISTRPAGKFSEPETGCCFDLVNAPLTEISEVPFTDDQVKAIDEFDPDCVVFTSEKGAALFFSEIDPHLSGRPRNYYGIGPSTCREVMENGLSCKFPEVRTSEGLANFLARNERNSKLLLFRSSRANSVLDEILDREKIEFQNITAYNVSQIKSKEIMRATEPDCFGVIFTSSMEVESFVGNLGDKVLEIAPGIKLFSIGEPTSETLKKHSLAVSEPIGNSDFDDLFEEICSLYCS